MSHLSEDWKGAAEAIGALLQTPAGRRTLRLVGYTNADDKVDSDRVFAQAIADRPSDGDAPMRVGVWTSASGDRGPLRRQPQFEPLELWSQVETIPVRDPGRKRVVLLGESCARGIFQDPHVNPSLALQRMLSAAVGDDVDVVDLARTDILMLPLLRLGRAALALKPDAVVLFAGNNWHPGWALRHRLPELALRLRRERDWRWMRECAQEAIGRHVRLFMSSLQSMLAEANVPLVVMIPEINLADWRDHSAAPPLLQADVLERWLEAKDGAEQALARGDSAAATTFGHELLRLDGGSTPLGSSVLADAASLDGDVPQARRHARASHEASLFWLHTLSPGIYTSTRDAMLAETLPGTPIVDLQTRCQDDRPDELPGRRLFHDYCHLTLEGIQFCMGHAAAALLPLIGGPRWTAEQLAAVEQHVSPDVIAGSHLLAAVFNANHQQSRDVVRHHLTEATRHSPIARRLVELFVDFHVRRAPSLLCDSFEAIQQTLSLTNVHFMHGFGVRRADKSLNLELVAECSRAVAAAQPALELKVERLIADEHRVSSAAVDLLDRAYAPRDTARSRQRDTVGYYRAFERASTFQIVVDTSAPLRLELTYRVDGARDGREIAIDVNGQRLTALPASDRWRREDVIVDCSRLTTPIVSITVRWPVAEREPQDWIDDTAELLESNVVPEISPVFGHIHRFTARRVQAA